MFPRSGRLGASGGVYEVKFEGEDLGQPPVVSLRVGEKVGHLTPLVPQARWRNGSTAAHYEPRNGRELANRKNCDYQ